MTEPHMVTLLGGPNNGEQHPSCRFKCGILEIMVQDVVITYVGDPPLPVQPMKVVRYKMPKHDSSYATFVKPVSFIARGKPTLTVEYGGKSDTINDGDAFYLSVTGEDIPADMSRHLELDKLVTLTWKDGIVHVESNHMALLHALIIERLRR